MNIITKHLNTMIRKKSKAYYSISAVARIFSVHQQTIRMYEKEGLLCPKRSEGNTRMFTEEDIERLEEIIYCTHTLGINLAGVEMILKLKKQIKKLQREMNELFKHAHEELDVQAEVSKQLIERSSHRLVQFKNGQSDEDLATPSLLSEFSSKTPALTDEKHHQRKTQSRTKHKQSK